jgi:hypothetical protein
MTGLMSHTIYPGHCEERSDAAIQGHKKDLDCFAARAPRNDGADVSARRFAPFCGSPGSFHPTSGN